MKRILIMITLLLVICVYGDWQLEEGFEGGEIPADWTVYNGSEGSTWTAYENEDYAHGGIWSAFTDSYYPEDEDNWLVLPQLEIADGDSLSLFIRSWYDVEEFEILASTESNEINDFDYDLLTVAEQGIEYTGYVIDLSEFAGEGIYLAIHWNCLTYGLLVDNVRVGQESGNELVMNLPDSFSFNQGELLAVDFGEYILGAEPETAEISVSGNEHIEIEITGFLVNFACLNWNGTEELEFTVTDNMGNYAIDQVMVEVTASDVYDLGLIEITAPQYLVSLLDYVHPEVVLENTGNQASGALNLNLECEIIDSEAQIVFESSHEVEIELAASQTESVIFTESWQPVTEDDFTVMVSFELTDADPGNNQIESEVIVRQHYGSGGPDEFGYRWIDNHQPDGPEYNWIEISETGSSAITYNVSGFSGDDNFSEPIEFGFDFNFYGINYSNFHVDTNGEILLADNTWYEAYPSNGWDNDGNVFNWVYPIPGYTQMPALIAVYWDDLEADEGVGDVYFQTFGESPERYCVVEWHNLRFHTGEGGDDLLKFEAVFYETGEILMQYKKTSTGQTGSNAPHDYGQSATVAIQNEAADMGLCYLQEQVEGSTWIGVEPEGNILTDELAISIFTGEDNSAPYISHEPVGNTLLESIDLYAAISDMSGIEEAKLFYNLGSNWQEMEQTEFIEPNIYRFSLAGLEAGTEVQYYFFALDGSETGNSGTLPLQAPTEYFCFRVLPWEDNQVLLAYSGNQDYTGEELTVWQETLDASGISFDQYNWQQTDQVVIPQQYKAIYFFANSSSHSAELDSLCLAMMDWLDEGNEIEPRNLFFSSDGFAYNQSGHPNASPMKKLLNAYFRTSYVATGVGGGTNGLGGPNHPFYESGSFQIITDSPVGEEGEEIDVFANSPDCIFRYEACPSWYEDEVINPEIGAHNAFIFEDGPYGGQAYLYHGVCGTWIDNLIYKAFYFSFDLSQINDELDRQRLIADSFDWFDLDVEKSEENIAIVEPGLSQNYPNPFYAGKSERAETIIRFWSGETSKAELSIYNIRGRKIRSLRQDVRESTWESFSWDGKDKTGNFAASGLYLYRLELDGNICGEKKMILIR